jgi:glycosyltransferase involved in cell wall biosynthesis
MSFSLPVIAARVGGIPELVSDGVCGLLISRGDQNALAENIVRLASDERVRRQMGEESRKRAEALFDVRRTAALYLQRCGITDPN